MPIYIGNDILKLNSGGNYLGQVERVPAELFCLVKGHDLDLDRPRGVVAARDRIVQVPGRIVRVVGAQLVRLLRRQVADPLVALYTSPINNNYNTSQIKI